MNDTFEGRPVFWDHVTQQLCFFPAVCCAFCGQPDCDPVDDYCYGCKAVVCVTCALREAVCKAHTIQDHGGRR